MACDHLDGREPDVAAVRVKCICELLWVHVRGEHDDGGKPAGMVGRGQDGGNRSHILQSLRGLRCPQETDGNLRHQVRSDAQRQIRENRRREGGEIIRSERWIHGEQQIEPIRASHSDRYAESGGPLAVSAHFTDSYGGHRSSS